MRSLVLAAALLAITAPAAGWETVVTDRRGRTVELRGYEAEKPGSGIVILCYPDTGESALIFAREASKDYSLRPGAAVTIDLGVAQIAGELMDNDSRFTSASATVPNLPELLSQIASGDDLTVRLAELEGTEAIVPVAEMEPALSEFLEACAY